MPNYDYYDTITIRDIILRYYHYQRYPYHDTITIRYPYHDTITISDIPITILSPSEISLLQYYHYQRYPYHDTITIKGLISQCITILSPSPNHPVFHWISLILSNRTACKDTQHYCPLKYPFCYLLTNSFAKQKSSLFPYRIYKNKKLSKLSIVEESIGYSYRLLKTLSQ